jgi:hypothetical protein
MGGRPAQDIDEGLLGILATVERAEQNRALDFALDGFTRGGVTRQQIVQLPQSRLLRQPGRPASIGAGIAGRGGRFLVQSGHDARWSESGDAVVTTVSRFVPHARPRSPTMAVSIAGYFRSRPRNVRTQISRSEDFQLQPRQDFVYQDSTWCESPPPQ